MMIWLFSVLLHRDIRSVELFSLIPAIVVIPLIWTVIVNSIEQTNLGLNAVVTEWFFLYALVHFGYYIAAIVQLTIILQTLRKTRNPVDVRKIGILLGSVIALTVLEILTPISFGLPNIEWLPSVINLCLIIPPLLMGSTFLSNQE
jgi:hypothetical protein